MLSECLSHSGSALPEEQVPQNNIKQYSFDSALLVIAPDSRQQSSPMSVSSVLFLAAKTKTTNRKLVNYAMMKYTGVIIK